MDTNAFGSRRLIVIIAVLIVIPIGVLLWTNRPPDDNDGGNPQPLPPPKETGSPPAKGGGNSSPFNPAQDALAGLAARARELQREDKRPEAEQAWQAVLRKIGGLADAQEGPAVPHDELDGLRVEANRNLAELKRLQPRRPANEWAIDKGAGISKDETQKDQLLERYPIGRKIQSVAVWQIKGTGSNEAWALKTDANFLYQYRVAVTTEVIENNGVELHFVQDFREVLQERATCDRTVQLRSLPPVAREVFRVFEETVLLEIPVYRVVRKVAGAYSTIDPQGKRLLTKAADLLQGAGVLKEDWDKVELAAEIDKLQGTKVRMEYWAGFGVTALKIEKGPVNAFSESDLERLAHGSSLLMDHYVYPAAEKKVGETWEVEARHLQSLFNLYEASVDGSLRLKRLADKESAGQQLVELDVTGGELSVSDENAGARRQATLRPKSGRVTYSPRGHYVESGSLDWDSTTVWFTSRHLLFGTTKTRNLQVRTEYRARDVTKSGKASVGVDR